MAKESETDRYYRENRQAREQAAFEAKVKGALPGALFWIVIIIIFGIMEGSGDSSAPSKPTTQSTERTQPTPSRTEKTRQSEQPAERSAEKPRPKPSPQPRQPGPPIAQTTTVVIGNTLPREEIYISMLIMGHGRTLGNCPRVQCRHLQKAIELMERKERRDVVGAFGYVAVSSSSGQATLRVPRFVRYNGRQYYFNGKNLRVVLGRQSSENVRAFGIPDFSNRPMVYLEAPPGRSRTRR